MTRTTKNSQSWVHSENLPPLDLVGFGSQGKAWALNLRDSNHKVRVLLRKNSKSTYVVKQLGFEVLELNETNLKNSKILLLLIPDSEQRQFLIDHKNHLSHDSLILYAHGFCISSTDLLQHIGHLHHGLLAPKAIASEVRFQYETKGKLLGVHDLICAENTPNTEADKLLSILLKIGKDLGLTSNYKNHFAQETKADLFSEQSLLCSLLPYGAKFSFEKLVANGIDPKLAMLECFLELRSISKALVDLGPEAFFKLISPNALLGSEKAYELMFDHAFEEKLEKLWRDIDNGEFQKYCNDVNQEDIALIRERILKRFRESKFHQTFETIKSELT